MSDFCIHEITKYGHRATLVFEGSLSKDEAEKTAPVGQIMGHLDVFLFRGDEQLEERFSRYMGRFFGQPYNLHILREIRKSAKVVASE